MQPTRRGNTRFMIEYRAFRNTDPPLLAEIWRSHGPLRALVRSMTVEILETEVFSKPFFDRLGLIVAVDDGRPIGFIHVGFGPTADGQSLDFATGVVCLLMVWPHPNRAEIATRLLEHGEQYLVERGARTLYGGAASPNAPFYHGLYGGGVVPGVLVDDTLMLETLQRGAYREQSRRTILHRSLDGFRQVVDRQLMRIRRDCQVQVMIDPPADTWWEACTDGWGPRIRFSAHAHRDGRILACLTFCDMQTMAREWGVSAMGLDRTDIPASDQRQNVAVFLIGEAMRQLASDGINLVEAHARQPASDLDDVLSRLGFQPVDEGIVLCKSLGM